MESIFNFIAEQFTNSIEAFFTEAFVYLFLLGLLIFFIGLFFIYSIVYPRLFGPSPIKGRVLGAIEHDIPLTNQNDKVGTSKKMSFLFPIYGYKKTDGTKAFVRGVSAGTHVLKYKTGQAVNIIIHDEACEKSDTATDINNMSLLYWGGGLMTLGLCIMGIYAVKLSLLSISLSTLITILIAILVKTRFKPRKEKKELVLDFSKIHPIEHFVKKNSIR